MTQNVQQNPTVSVCVPSYNHSRYIQLCLKSIFAQTYKSLELIVIDDGSTDGSAEIIEKTLKDCPFPCELITRPNKGHIMTMKEGLERSRGEFHAIIASDDLWLPKFLERRVGQLQDRPDAVLAFGHCYTINEDDKIFGVTSDWVEYEDGNVRNMLIKQNFPMAPAILYRKTALEIEKWNPDVFVEDYEMLLRLSTLGEFAFEPEPLSAHRTHSTNISRQTELIVNSKTQALRLNAERLGISSKELGEIITKTKWESADYCLNSGNRLLAVKLSLQNFRAKDPKTTKQKRFLKLLMPNILLEAYRRIIKRKSDTWSGVDIKTMIFGQADGSYVDRLSA